MTTSKSYSPFSHFLATTFTVTVRFCVVALLSLMVSGTGASAQEAPTATVSISGGGDVSEGGDAIFVVTLSGSPGADVVVSYATSSGTATAGDFTSRSRPPLIFFRNSTSLTQEITVPVTDDNLAEGAETFTMTLSAPSAGLPPGVHLGTATATATIAASDPATVSISGGGDVSEGGNAIFTVTLSNPSEVGDVVVNYATSLAVGDTAAAGDFTETSGTLTFEAGTPTLTREITVPLPNDNRTEGDETFTMTLSAPGDLPAGVSLDATTAQATIAASDPATVSISGGRVSEGGDAIFTTTIDRMSERDSSNTHEIISALFLAMNTEPHDRDAANVPRWANDFPYVNGGLFSGSTDVPVFSRIARSFLLRIGRLDWQQINPDIFGSMIQAVTDDEERGELGMHYTSVPNILKVLNPLFLDDLRAKLDEAGDNSRKLLNLRKRMSNIRVFDPACGSGNFLVIAYKEMRQIEAEINTRRKESGKKTAIPLTNFRGIELRDFPAEIARLALIIAEYQCDVLHRGQRDALADFLPLDAMNWITCGNSLLLDWLSICPPTGTGVKLRTEDLFESPLDQAEIDFENEGGETYICGNPPYLGSKWQSKEQKEDLKRIFDRRTKSWKSLDYVAGWFMKAADYGLHTPTVAAFVSTNSINQGQQVPILWPLIFGTGHEIAFAHTSFKWANLASHNAGVTVVIVGISNHAGAVRRLFSVGEDNALVLKEAENINAYLVAGADVIVEKTSKPLSEQAAMNFDNKPVDGGNLLLSPNEVERLHLTDAQHQRFIRRIYGSAEFIKGLERYCLWIEDQYLEEAMQIDAVQKRIEGVQIMRLKSRDKSANEMAKSAHQFREMYSAQDSFIVIPRVSSESRDFLPVGLLKSDCVTGDRNFALYDAPPLEHGPNRLAPTLGLDRHGLCADANRFFLFQHPWLEHLSCPDPYPEKQS